MADFVLLAEENRNWNRPPHTVSMSSSVILLLQKFSPTPYRSPLRNIHATHKLPKPLKFTTGIKLQLKSTTYYRNLPTSQFGLDEVQFEINLEINTQQKPIIVKKCKNGKTLRTKL